MLVERVSGRLGALITKGETVLWARRQNPGSIATLDERRYTEWRSQALALLTQVFDPGHTYTAAFRSQVDDGARIRHVERGLGVLQAALEDVKEGHLETLQEMAVAEVFSDFLDQADHLLQNGYSAPAASLTGAVLEKGLRALATRKGIAVRARDNLSSLNNKIGDKGVYNRLRQKQVAFWIDVRNAADHGNFDDFTDRDVSDLIKGVQSFLATVV